MTKDTRAVFVFAAFITTIVGCHKPTPSPANNIDRVPLTAVLPDKPVLQLSTKLVEPGLVEFTVKTNLPTPLAAMASLDLQGQKDHDTAIGTSHKFTLTGPTTIFLLKAINDDDGMDGKVLPDGRYEADVIVGPKWEENKGIEALPENLEVKQTVELHSGRSRASVEHQDKLQEWVIDNVPSDSHWDEQKFKAQLGPYEKSASTVSSLHDAYYFPEADMTLIVNRVRQEVSVWRVGRAPK